MKGEKLAKKSKKKGQQEGRRSRRTCMGIERISVRKGPLVTKDTERLREVQAVGPLGSH